MTETAMIRCQKANRENPTRKQDAIWLTTKRPKQILHQQLCSHQADAIVTKVKAKILVSRTISYCKSQIVRYTWYCQNRQLRRTREGYHLCRVSGTVDQPKIKQSSIIRGRDNNAEGSNCGDPIDGGGTDDGGARSKERTVPFLIAWLTDCENCV